MMMMLAGIAPPDIRRDVCARMERTKQMEQDTHSLFGHIQTRIPCKSYVVTSGIGDQGTSHH